MFNEQRVITIERRGMFAVAKHVLIEDAPPGAEMLVGEKYSRDFGKVFNWAHENQFSFVHSGAVTQELSTGWVVTDRYNRTALFYNIPLVKARFAEIAEEIKKKGVAIDIPSDVGAIARYESLDVIHAMTDIRFTRRNGKLNVDIKRADDYHPSVKTRGVNYILGALHNATQTQYGVKIVLNGPSISKANTTRMVAVAKKLFGVAATKKMIDERLEEFKRDVLQHESSGLSEAQQKKAVADIQTMVK